MVDRSDSSDVERGASLLSIAHDLRDDSAAQPFDDDPVTRHRAARQQKAQENGSADPRYDRPAWAGPKPEAHNGVNPAAFQEYEWVSRPQDWQSADAHASPAPQQAGRQQSPTPVRTAREADYSDYDEYDNWQPLIDPRIVARRILRSKFLITSTTLAGALLGVGLALSIPKKYIAVAQVEVSANDLNVLKNDLNKATYSPAGELGIIDSQALIMSSGPVLAQAAANANLANDPEFNGKGGGGLDPVGMVRGILSRSDAPTSDQLEDRVVKALGERVKVERVGKSFTFNIKVSTENPTTSAKLANEIVAAYFERAKTLRSDTAGRASNELTRGLEQQRQALEQAEALVEAFKAENGIFDPKGQSIADNELVALNDELGKARARQTEIRARAESAKRADVDSVVNGGLPEGLASTTLTELRVQYAAAKQGLDSAAVKFGPRHPQLQALQAQLDGAHDQIRAELRRIVQAQQEDLRRSVEIEQDLSRRLSQLKVQFGDTGQDIVKLRQLERDAQAKRNVYESMLQRARETGEQKQIDTSDAKVISQAAPPLEPTGPSRAVMVAGMTTAGMLGGPGLAGLLGAIESLRTSSRASNRRPTGKRRFAADDHEFEPIEAPSEGDMYANQPSYPYRAADRQQPAEPAYAPQRQYQPPQQAPAAPAAYQQAAYAPPVDPYAPQYDPYAQPQYPHAQPFDPYAQAYDPYAQAPAPYPQQHQPQQGWQQGAPQYAPQEPAYPAYADAQHPGWQPAPAYPVPAYAPPAYPPQQAYPYPPHAYGHQGWAPAPQHYPAYASPQPAPGAAPVYEQQPVSWEPTLEDWRRAAQKPASRPVYPSPAASPSAADMSESIAELRATLRECRDAMMQIAANDMRRRY